MLDALNSALCGIAGVLFLPFRNMDPWAGLAAAALVTAAAALLVYRAVSNQQAIRTAKDRIKAHLMEVRLYGDDPRVVLQAQGRLLVQNLRYLGHSMKPLLVLGVPLALFLIQMEARFGQRPLAPGETAILELSFQPGMKPSEAGLSLESGPGVAVETPPLRIDAARVAAWRLRAAAPGRHTITVKINDQSLPMEVAVGGGIQPIPARRIRGSWLERLAVPCESALPESSPVSAIKVQYPVSRVRLAAWEFHWLVAYIVLCIIFALALKGPFRTEL